VRVAAVSLAALLPAVAWAQAEHLPRGFPTREGRLVFCSARTLAQWPCPELDWLRQFEVVLTNGYDLPAPAARAALRAAGSRLFRYFWVAGFPEAELEYSLPDGAWRQEIVQSHPEWLLAPEPLPGPAGTPPSYYYDLADAAPAAFLADRLAAFRTASGYDGYLLDYAGIYALPPEAQERWQQRHPALPYDRALTGFLGQVRRRDPAGLLATNQAFRSDQPLASQADYDLAESYGTSYAWGPVTTVNGREVAETYTRPWAGPGGLEELYGTLAARPAGQRPRRCFLVLDYMRPGLVRGPGEPEEVADVEAVYYSYAAAALFGLPSFCSGWYGREYRGPLYFADLGRALGEGPTKVGAVVLREYERGLVALLAGADPAQASWTMRGSRCRLLYDLRTGRRLPVRGGRVTLRLRPARGEVTGTVRPVGRVYLKVGPAPSRARHAATDSWEG